MDQKHTQLICNIIIPIAMYACVISASGVATFISKLIHHSITTFHSFWIHLSRFASCNVSLIACNDGFYLDEWVTAGVTDLTSTHRMGLLKMMLLVVIFIGMHVFMNIFIWPYWGVHIDPTPLKYFHQFSISKEAEWQTLAHPLIGHLTGKKYEMGMNAIMRITKSENQICYVQIVMNHRTFWLAFDKGSTFA